MNFKGKKITLHDMCLRDGMHPKQHQITIDQMIDVACALDDAGVPLIEVTHGDGLGGSSVNYGFPAASDEAYLDAVIAQLNQQQPPRIAMLGGLAEAWQPWLSPVSRQCLSDALASPLEGATLLAQHLLDDGRV